MKKNLNWKTFAAITAAIAIFGAGVLLGAGTKPTSVIHVVTIDWVDGATEEQIGAALKGVEKMAQTYDGIERVWTRCIKAQGRQSAFVMEFKSEQALKDYAGSDAQQEWYKVYTKVRGQSRTFDITN